MITRTVNSVSEAFGALIDPAKPLKMVPWIFRFGHTTEQGNAAFLCLLASRSNGPIVEFGTFIGRTALNMSLNTQHPIYTIDSGVPDDPRYGDYVPGEDFIDADIANKPHLLLGDSRTVDIPVKPHTAGFVYVDGGHSYEVVKSDSARALELVHPDGFVVWDDYHGTWPGVIRALDELSETVSFLLVQKECYVLWGSP
jgi:predicted O-methyltransferase YrrM